MIALWTPFALLMLLLVLLLLLSLLVGSLEHLFVSVLVGIGAAIITTLTPLLFEADAAFAQNPVIMFGELEIIFALHAIAAKLGVPSHVLVFFEQLSGIAALPGVLTVAGLPTSVRWPLSPTAATAAALSIIDQMPTSLRSRSFPRFHPQSLAAQPQLGFRSVGAKA